MERIGVCPVRSDELVSFAINMCAERGVLSAIGEDDLGATLEALSRALADHYLTDVYIDLPLTRGPWLGMATTLDLYDRSYLEYQSGGTHLEGMGLDPMCAPSTRDALLVVRATPEGIGSKVADVRLEDVTAELLADAPELAPLAGLPVQVGRTEDADGIRLTVTSGVQDARRRFSRLAHKGRLLTLVRSLGCDEGAVSALEAASFNCGVPYLDSVVGYVEWVVATDVVALTFTVESSAVTDVHATLRISDRSMVHAGNPMKPTKAYQWHITDDCDQRCKHCYLFAEDARLACVSTPYDQLIHTLDEMMIDADRRHALPMPVVSGGDPILHPRFWDLCEELSRRGLQWNVLGNPFHIDEASARRLHELGCSRYQLSLDGLEPFHDHMRKPGSHKATLSAARILTDAGVAVQFMATASRQNLDDIIALMDVAVECGVASFTFARYCATSPEKARDAYPAPLEYRDFLLRYREKAKRYQESGAATDFHFKEHLFTLLEFELGTFRPTEYGRRHPGEICGGCHLGQACAILPTGEVVACRRMESPIGNVRTQSLSDIFTGEACMGYVAIDNIRKCRDCELLQYCRGCRAVGFNVTGDLQGEDPCCWREVPARDDAQGGEGL